jgi:hypothetical protein
MKIPIIWKFNLKVMVFWTYMKMHLSLHICKQLKSLLSWHPRNMTKLCIGLHGLSGNFFFSYECGQMDNCRLCLTSNNMKTLCNMFIRSWAILSFNKPIVYSRHNIGNEGYNYGFNNVSHSMWCVIKFGHHSTHLHFIYNQYPSWGQGIGEIWILPTQWIC